MRNKFFFTLAMIWAFGALYANEPEDIPKLPIGMNLDGNNYWTTALIFRDVMKTASRWITYNVSVQSPWDTQKTDLIPVDEQGYPLELPYKVSEDLPPQGVRFMLNNNYKGRYVFTYDGEGEFEFSIPHAKIPGKTIFKFSGEGSNVWVQIKKSIKGNHVRNIHILPEEDAEDTTTLFNPLYVEGLRPFHCLRFMDWMNTNGLTQKTWNQRSKPDYYSQGLEQGIAIEYVIDLCNLLHTDGWFCIPHQANDDYIRNFALLVRDKLDPNLKVYIEYSNEIWNWQFAQAGYVLKNAPGALDSYVSEDLAKISVKMEQHPEKDAYMMQRTFKIWSDVFGDSAKTRLVRVAAVQQAWTDNTRRILQYLFKKDQKGNTVYGTMYTTSTGAGCDAVSPSGYFSYSDEDAKQWESMDPSKVTADLILDEVDQGYWNNSGKFTAETAKFAKAWNVDYIVYEGGQHIQPPQQKEWLFNPAIWAAQIDPKIYNIYMKLFRQEVSMEVNCKLFCAFSYVGKQKARWGSWGHLDNLNQLKDPSKLKEVAPKFKALLDANTPKDPSRPTKSAY